MGFVPVSENVSENVKKTDHRKLSVFSNVDPVKVDKLLNAAASRLMSSDLISNKSSFKTGTDRIFLETNHISPRALIISFLHDGFTISKGNARYCSEFTEETPDILTNPSRSTRFTIAIYLSQAIQPKICSKYVQ